VQQARKIRITGAAGLLFAGGEAAFAPVRHSSKSGGGSFRLPVRSTQTGGQPILSIVRPAKHAKKREIKSVSESRRYRFFHPHPPQTASPFFVFLVFFVVKTFGCGFAALRKSASICG
jgi:hypothetical protein